MHVIYGPDGNPVPTPEQYSKNFKPITKEDCFCYVKGDTSNIEDFFKNNFKNLNFTNNLPNCNAWRNAPIDWEDIQEIVKNNKTLIKISEVLQISHCLVLEVSINSQIPWHYDYPRKGPAINLLLTPEGKSHSLFTYNIPDTSNLIECRYRPHQFVLYNTDIIHTVLNFEPTRYMFSVCFERGKTNLSWAEAKEIFSDLDLIDANY